MSGPLVLIMAGGTGGHIFPALAVARELESRGCRLAWLGTAEGLEAEIIPREGLPLHTLSVVGLRGKGLLRPLAAVPRLLRAMLQALGLMRRLRPACVLGMGGFVSGPGGLAARVLGRPLVIHEQNAVAGTTNRLLAPLATRVLEAFPGTFSARAKAVALGNPVRASLCNLPGPEERLAGREGRRRLLVLGGSRGALAINRVLPRALALLDVGARPEVRHQTGAAHLEATRAAYAAAGVEAEVIAFVDDMAEAYAWADLALCRAGALTLSELATLGLGSVLIPFPHAVDDHQRLNAKRLADAGAAVLLPQEELDPERLAFEFKTVLAPERCLELARQAARLGRPRAAQQVADVCEEVML